MGDYKLIVLDMDGTFLMDNKKVSQENKDAVQAAAAAGVTVMFATGRGIMNVLPYMEEIQMSAPIITVNGSEVWERPGVLHSRTLLDSALVSEFHQIAVECSSWYWANAVDERFEKGEWPDLINEKQWLKFGFHTEDEDMLSAVHKRLERYRDVVEISNSHPLNIELNTKGVNKVVGVRQVCKLLGINMAEVIAVGDSINDELLLREAGLGVAMGNAQHRIKQAADIVVSSNEEHGVAETIEKYMNLSRR